MGLKKVHLYNPWKFPDSPYYKYLIQNPPEGIEYIYDQTPEVILNRRKFVFSNKIKKVARSFLRRVKISVPNARRIKMNEGCSLVHCAHCMNSGDDPWVADFEDFWQLFIGKSRGYSKKRVRNILMKENCRKIMPWTNWLKEKILETFPDVEKKIEVVYPAIPMPKIKKKKNKKVTILYVSRYFWIKGGLIALEVLEKLREKYDLEIIFIADAPEKIKKKYPSIKIQNLVPHSELLKIYSRTDILFYPTLMDTFGFALLEAMSFGIPIVATYHHRGTPSMKEIVKDGERGFVVEFKKEELDYYKVGKEEKELIKKLVEKMSVLIGNRELRGKMSKNCLKEIREGKFSIKNRNQKLKKIYSEAVKSGN